MKLLIRLKYQKWLLIVPFIFVTMAALINYLYNIRILRVFQIMIVYLFTGFIIMYIWLILKGMPRFNNFCFLWFLLYLIGTPFGLYIIAMQEKDIKWHERNQLTKINSDK